MQTIKIKTAIVIFLLFPLVNCKVKSKVDYRVIRVSNGWGYELFSNEKIIVHQEIIPVIEGNSPFLSRNDAKKTGKLALQKLSNGSIPLITRQDLDSLGIIYP